MLTFLSLITVSNVKNNNNSSGPKCVHTLARLQLNSRKGFKFHTELNRFSIIRTLPLQVQLSSALN